MKTLVWIKQFCEYIGGSEDRPPPGVSAQLSSWLWGAWWGLLACLIMLFCGQTSKFIYIDF